MVDILYFSFCNRWMAGDVGKAIASMTIKQSYVGACVCACVCVSVCVRVDL